MKKFYFLILGILHFWAVSVGYSQPWYKPTIVIPQMRQIFHDNVDAAQQKVLAQNCNKDSIYLASSDTIINQQITFLLKNKIDDLQTMVEVEAIVTESKKFTLLRGIVDLLETYSLEFRLKQISPLQLGNLILSYEKAINLDIANQPITPLIETEPLEIGSIIAGNFALKNNSGQAQSKDILRFKFLLQNRNQIMKFISSTPNFYKADTLLGLVAYSNPQLIYNYAAANDDLGKRIRSSDNKMIQTISLMANNPNGRFMFPFLDEIYENRLSIAEIEQQSLNDEAYYKLLVKTELAYEQRKQQGQKPLAMDALTEKLKSKAIEIYINEINGLHDEPNAAIRFAKLQNLAAEDLYFLAVLGEDELYTSSFVSGVYPRIMEKLGKVKSDSLMRLVNYDHFRKFIKLCAGYNTLDDYLSKMDRAVAETQMRSFVDGLSYSGVEDAVDVADSYASLKDSSIRKIVLEQVSINYQKNVEANNKIGKVVYGLLKTLFATIDTSNKAIATAFKVPNVYKLELKDFKDDKGKINVQQFFYGDKDGNAAFNNFIGNFRSMGWRINYKPDWVEVSTTSGQAITIFANKPLDETKDLDALAQAKLNNYLDSLEIYPTIAIHRGHSYYVKSSIQQITSSAKLVVLGSCGGYNNLSQVLSVSPKAQIIASKQVGTGTINNVLIEYILENLKQNKDINWPQAWKTIEAKFANRTEVKERFDDYIPPHKNLGAIFIMAYYNALQEL